MSDTPIAPAVGALTLAGIAASLTLATSTVRTPTIGTLTAAGVASTLTTAVPPLISEETQNESGIYAWPNLANGQVGGIIASGGGYIGPLLLRYRCVSTQASGVWGSGGSVKLQGSNDGINWNDLSSAALTGAGLFAALGAQERPKFVRPNVTAGDSTTAITIVAWFS